jgi:hypothetical protein
MTWRVQVGSVHETGGLVLRIGSVGGQRGGENIPGAPNRPNPLFQVFSRH